MSTSVTPEINAPEPAAPSMSAFAKLIGIFHEPSKVFEAMALDKGWGAPLLAMVIIAAMSIGFVTVAGQKVGWEQIQANNLKFAPKFQQNQLAQLTPEQREVQLRRSLPITKGISYSFSILLFIWWVIVALILWATFSFGLGAEVNFGTSLKIILMAVFPGIIKTILATAVTFMLKDPETFFMQNPVGTNIGYYLSFESTPRWLYGAATGLDIFYIWSLVLTAIGFAVIGKVKTGTAYGVVFGWAILVTVVGAVVNMMFS